MNGWMDGWEERGRGRDAESTVVRMGVGIFLLTGGMHLFIFFLFQ